MAARPGRSRRGRPTGRSPIAASSNRPVMTRPSATRSQPRRRGADMRMWPAKHSSARIGSTMLSPLSRLMPLRAVSKPSEVSSGMRPSTLCRDRVGDAVEATLAQSLLQAVDGGTEVQIDGVVVERHPPGLARGEQRDDARMRAPVRLLPQRLELVGRDEAVESLADGRLGAGCDRRRQRVGALGQHLTRERVEVDRAGDASVELVRHRLLHRRALGDRRHRVDVAVGVEHGRACPHRDQRGAGQPAAEHEQQHHRRAPQPRPRSRARPASSTSSGGTASLMAPASPATGSRGITPGG